MLAWWGVDCEVFFLCAENLGSLAVAARFNVVHGIRSSPELAPGVAKGCLFVVVQGNDPWRDAVPLYFPRSGAMFYDSV